MDLITEQDQENFSFTEEEISKGAYVYSGYAFKSKDLDSFGIPVVKIGNIKNRAISLEQIQFFPENYAFSETGNPLKNKAPPKEPNTKSIRTSNWKLIFNEYDGTKELYDLKSDPNENVNLISKQLEIENELWEKLMEHL